MKRVRLILAYDGTDYVGWQTQPNGVSVQETIEKALFEVTGARTALHGSGLRELFKAIHRAHGSATREFSTADVTRAVCEFLASAKPPAA